MAEPVKVLNPYGEPETVDHGDLQRALAMGYKIPTAQEIQDYQDKQTYGEGMGNTLKAFGAGAARVATFGLSDQALTKTGLVQPETLSGLKKEHPFATGAGEITGVVASLLLAPEAKGVGAAREALETARATGSAAEIARAGEALNEAKHAFTAADALNPVSAVSKAGYQVSKAAIPGAEAAAGMLANPETSPVVNKIISKAVATGAGSAVEGLGYGLGQSVSEQALGDPDLNAEKVMSNIGLTSLFMGGMGSMLGAASGALARKGPKALEGFEKPPETIHGQAGDFEASVRASDLSDTEKESIVKGLTELKPDAKEIQAAANEIGAPVLPGQISGSKAVQKAQDLLLNGPPTMAALKQQTLAAEGFGKATQAVENVVGHGSEFSRYSVGEQLQESLGNKFETRYEPIKQLYAEVEPYAQAIPVSDRSTGSLSRNILKLIDEKSLIQGTPRYNFVKTVAEGLEQVENLDRLKNFRSEISKSADHTMKDLAGDIADRLDGVEERAIKRFAETMKTPEAKEKILGLIEKSDAARAGYRALRQDMSELGKALGKGKFYGPKDFLNYLEETTPEKFARKLFAKDNVRFMRAFSEKFPEEMEIMKRYQLGMIREEASKKGFFDLRAAFRQVNKLEPEIKQILFTPDQLKKMQMAEKYVKSFPESFNPSGTSHADTFRHHFESGITGAITSNARDWAIDKFIRNAVKMDPESGQNIAALVKLERTAQEQTQKVARGAKAIFKVASATTIPVTASMMSGDKKRKEFEKTSAQVSELANNPEKLIDMLDHSTRDLYAVAPKMAGGVHQSAIRATQFLHTKLPVPPMRTPFAPKWVPSHAEVEKFNRYYSVVENPINVLEQVKTATVTPEAVETLQVVYPKLYQEMQAQVMEAVTDHMAKKDSLIPYRTKQALSTFLGQDLDGSLTPQSIHANQMALAPPQMQPQGMAKPSKTGMEKLTASSRMLTSMQANAQRENA